MLDLTGRLCYSNNYLSEERFLFARKNCGRQEFQLPYREANARTEKRTNNIGGAESMADNRVKITLRCEECKQRNYNTIKNKKNTSQKLERKKYCPFCRKHTKHVETK